jgi:hypothetical protein
VVVVAPISAIRGEPGPPALLHGLEPIAAEELDQFLCTAGISAVIRDAKGNIAFASRSARTYSPAKRRAMLATNPTCAFEGCTRPAVESDYHHVEEVNQGGETIVTTGAPLCFVHHPKIHLEGWALLPRGDGTFRTVAPDDPDNPRTGLSPEEYIKRRRAAIFNRGQRRRHQSASGPDPPPR